MKNWIKKLFSNKFLSFVIWVIITMIITSFIGTLLTAASTFLNLIGVVLLLSWCYISAETKMFLNLYEKNNY